MQCRPHYQQDPSPRGLWLKGPPPVPEYSPGGGWSGHPGGAGVACCQWDMPGSADAAGCQVIGDSVAAPSGVPHRLSGTPCRGAGWGAPPLLPAPAAFALGRGEWHRLPSPSRDSREGAQGRLGAGRGGGLRAGASAVRGDAGAAPCPPR